MPQVLQINNTLLKIVLRNYHLISCLEKTCKSVCVCISYKFLKT
jgi:hypothetical protein